MKEYMCKGINYSISVNTNININTNTNKQTIARITSMQTVCIRRYKNSQISKVNKWHVTSDQEFYSNSK